MPVRVLQTESLEPLAIDYRPVASLIPYARNARTHSEAQVALIAGSIREYGFTNPILVDGDNGIIALVIGRLSEDGSDALIHSWVMSCRVLGRQVEAATLMLIAQEARRLGATRLVGEYRPSAKNDMVREHYQRLGFTRHRSFRVYRKRL